MTMEGSGSLLTPALLLYVVLFWTMTPSNSHEVTQKNIILYVVTDVNDNQTEVVMQGELAEKILFSQYKHSANANIEVKVQPTREGQEFKTVRSVCELSENNLIVGLTITKSCASASALGSVFEATGSPHVQWTDQLCEDQAYTDQPRHSGQHLTNLRVSTGLLFSSLLEQLDAENQDKFVIIYDQQFATVVADHAHHTHGDSLMYDTTTFVNDVRVFRHLESLRATYKVYLYLTASDTSEVFHRASQIPVLGILYHWIVLTTDQQVLRKTFTHEDNVLIIDARGRFSLNDYNFDPDENHVKDINILYGVRLIMDQILMKRDYIPYQNTTCPSSNGQTDLMKSIEASLATSTKLPMLATDTHRGQLKLIGYWNPHHVSQQLPRKLVLPFEGFRNRTFNVTTVPNKMFQVKQPDGTYKGLAFDIMDELALLLNFTYVITEPTVGTWGVEVPGGWDGMMGMVVRKEVDLGVGSFTMTYNREAVVDFSTPFWSGSTSMLFRTEMGDNKLLVYLNPFPGSLWTCIFVSLPILSSALWLMTRLSPIELRAQRFRLQRSRRKRRRKRTGASRLRCDGFAFGKILLEVFGGLFVQSMPWTPKAMSARILVSTMWIYYIILVSTYTGNLVAFLAVPNRIVPIDTLRDAVRQNTYAVGTIKGQALEDVLKSASPGIYADVWGRVKDNLVPTLQEGFKMVLKQNFILMDDTKNLVSVMAESNDSAKCSLYIATEKFYHTYYGFPFQEGSPYVDAFNRVILQMIDSGMIDQWMGRYWPKSDPDCWDSQSKMSTSPMSLEDTQGAFLLLFVGVGLAAMILFSETLCRRLTCRWVRKDFPFGRSWV